MGTRAGRKVRYGRLLVAALELEQVPRPLERVLAQVLKLPSPTAPTTAPRR